MSNRHPFTLNNCLHLARRHLPQACLLCGGRAVGEVLCPGCRNDLPRLPEPRCPVCAQPTQGGEICGACLRRPPRFDVTVAPFRYAFPLDVLVQRLKYHGELAVAGVFADTLAQALAGRPPPDRLIPMPLHPRRLAERGYNQAQAIARRLADSLALELDDESCRRLRDTRPQVGMDLRARRRNLRGAFGCGLDLAGARVALLDDVMTSGTSLNALAQAVRAAGAAHVEAWVAARAVAGQGDRGIMGP